MVSIMGPASHSFVLFFVTFSTRTTEARRPKCLAISTGHTAEYVARDSLEWVAAVGGFCYLTDLVLLLLLLLFVLFLHRTIVSRRMAGDWHWWNDGWPSMSNRGTKMSQTARTFPKCFCRILSVRVCVCVCRWYSSLKQNKKLDPPSWVNALHTSTSTCASLR